MITRWILYGLAITTMLACAGILAERIAIVFGRPRRVGWGFALLASLICTAVVPWRSQAPVINIAKVPYSAAATGGSEPLAFTFVPSSPWSITSLLERGRTALSDVVANANAVEPWLRAGWGLGALLLILTYTLGVVVLARRRRTWVPRRVDGIEVLVARRDGPAVLGLLQPRIVLPEWALTLDAPSRALMIRHECEHLRARDPVLLHAASLALILMPWNAAAWWIVRRLRLAIELDCDARVLHGTGCSSESAAVDAPRYGKLLLDVATHRSPANIRIAPALLEHTSSLSRRIAAMYPDRLRFPRMQGALAAASTVCLLVLAAELPVPSLSAQEPSMERLVGSATVAPAPLLSVSSTRALLEKFYPDVLRGEGPRSVGFVRDLSGRVIAAMSAHDVEMLVGEMRGRDERRAEQTEPMMGQLEYRRNMLDAEKREEPSRRELRTKVEVDVATTVQRKVEEASRAELMAKTQRGDVVNQLGRPESDTQARVERDLVSSREEKLKAAREAASENSSGEREAKVKLAGARLREAEQGLAEARMAGGDELRMKTELPRRSEFGSLAERTVAIDVVRHASGLFGREPVNIFFVTRNGPN